jgi:hypothetical protein
MLAFVSVTDISAAYYFGRKYDPPVALHVDNRTMVGSVSIEAADERLSRWTIERAPQTSQMTGNDSGPRNETFGGNSSFRFGASRKVGSCAANSSNTIFA